MTEMDQLVGEKIQWYKSRGQGSMTEMMINEIEGQFIDMARGGDGSCVGNGEIRKEYYGTMPDIYFQRVCDGMGWNWRS